MVTNKLQEENIARHKQLSDMEKMKSDLQSRIEFFKKKNIEIESLIKKRKEILDIKTGKLEYILEEKEALFNKLHLELAENKELKKKFNSYQKKKSKGFFSSFINYFQKEDLDNIDVSNGKVKKNILVDPKNLAKNFDNADSYIDNNPDFNTIDFNKIRLDISENNIMNDIIDNLEIKDNIEIQKNKENKEIEEKTENIEKRENKKKNENENNKGNEENDDDEHSEEDSGDESEDESDDDDHKDNILDRLRKNMDAVDE